MKHLFLTGDIQVGKSTAILRAIADFQLSIGGFCTIKGDVIESDGDYIHIVAADGREPCTPKNRVFFRCKSENRRKFIVYETVFNQRGSALLTPQEDWQLILMDEIGTAEKDCTIFRDKIFQTLDGPVPVLGVIQKREGGFLNEIRNHPSVEIIEVTIDNREQICQKIREYIHLTAENRPNVI